MSQVLINPQTGLAEQFEPDQAQEALQTGYHVPLNDPEGNPVSAPFGEAQSLIQQGHTQPNSAQLQNLLEHAQYDTTEHKVGSFVRGAVSSLTGGTGGAAEASLGGMPKEEQLKEQEQHPDLYAAGEAGGAILGTALLPEASVPGFIAKAGVAGEALVAGRGLLGAAGKLAARGAVEGALYALPHDVNEALLGDPHEVSEHVLGDIGLSTVLGAGGSLVFGSIGHGISKVLGKKAVTSAIEDASKQAVPEGTVPASIKQMGEMVAGAPDALQQEGMPSQGALRDAEQVIKETGANSQFPAHEAQYTSLEDPAVRLRYKSISESDTETGKAIRDYEAIQKKESQNLLQDTIQKIAPNKDLTSDPSKGGQKMLDAFKAVSEEEKKATAPGWAKFDKLAINPVSDPQPLIETLDKAIPGIGNALEVTPNEIKLQKYSPGMGWSKEVHGAAQDLVSVLNEPDLNLGKLRNVKNNIADKIHFTNPAGDNFRLGNLKSSLNQYINDAIPDAGFKELNKRYAIVSNQIETIEKMLGGKINQFAPYEKQIVPEDILSKLFSNSKAVQAAKSILPQDVFNEATGNYLTSKMASVTDGAKNGFSSQKFATFLSGKNAELQAAFSDDPKSLLRMRALTDKMRILPDSPPGNPSHSTDKAMSLMGIISKASSLFNKVGLASTISQKLMTPNQNARFAEEFNALMQGKTGLEATEAVQNKFMAYRVLQHLSDFKEKGSDLISRQAGRIFNPEVGAAVGAGLSSFARARPSSKEPIMASEPLEMNKIGTQVMNHSQNPTDLINHLSMAISNIQEHAPQTATALSSTVGRAVAFLASKVPAQDKSAPLDEPRVPSNSEIAQFNRYASIMEDPTEVLKSVRDGTLIPQDIEALTQVFPTLYNKMKSTVLDKMMTTLSKKESFEIPYKTKLGLSLFLGQNLDSTLSPQSIQFNQQVLTGAARQQAQQSMQQARPSKSGMSKMKSQNNEMTNYQQASSRRGSGRI